MPDRLELVVQLIHQRLAGGDVQLDDVGVGHVVQVPGSARRLLPWAAMITRWLDCTAGAIGQRRRRHVVGAAPELDLV